MTNEQLIKLLQEDLANERKHMMFYLQAGVMVKGLHREELSELFLKEALDEHKHVVEFSKLIVQLGGVPETKVNSCPLTLSDPNELLRYAVCMEQEVADIYATRLDTIQGITGIPKYVSLFYEDQLQDSQATALELNLYITA